MNTIRVLFVENQQFDMDAYADILTDCCVVTKAYDIYQARDRLEGQRILDYDIVALDVMMPNLRMYSESVTKRGLETGLRFFDEYLLDKPDKSSAMPVLFLTAATGGILESIKEYEAKYPQVKGILAKHESEPTQLREAIIEGVRGNGRAKGEPQNQDSEQPS